LRSATKGTSKETKEDKDQMSLVWAPLDNTGIMENNTKTNQAHPMQEGRPERKETRLYG
jgi:hypothetical protein